LSVKPHVNVIFYLEGWLGGKNGIYIENCGLGPAIIKAVSAEVGGKSYGTGTKYPWRKVFDDLTILPTCFKYGLIQPESALKSGEEFALLTVTHANPPVVDGRPCHLELLRLLRAEGLKVRIQYESMYGEPQERVADSAVDSDIISDMATAMVHQVAPPLVEKLQGVVEQLKQVGDKMQQSQAEAMKRMPYLAGLMLLRALYEDPPGAPPDWWFRQKGNPTKPED
jgi:hypothetical protein